MKHLLLALLIAWSALSFAAEPGPTASPAAEPAAAENARLREQNLLLNEQLRVTKEFQSSLLDAVWWAMTAVVTVGGLLVATNLFAAWRTRDSDRSLLLNEVKASAENLRAEVLEKANASATEISSRVDSRMEAQTEAVATELRNVRDLVSRDRNRTSDALVDLVKQIGEMKVETLKANFATDEVVRNLHKLTTEFHELETRVFDIQKVPVLRLMAASQSLESASKTGISNFVKVGANLIIDIVSEILNDDPTFSLRPSTKHFILSRIPLEHKEHSDLLAKAHGAVAAIAERGTVSNDFAAPNTPANS